MSQREFTVSISDAQFPLLSEQQGRTVMGAIQEEVYAKNNKPGLYYCHNVMPTQRGLDSVSYKQIIPALTSGTLVDVRVAYSSTRTRVHLGWNSTGEVYALAPDASVWLKLPAVAPTSPTFSISDVTIGKVNGVSYIFYAGSGAYTYNAVTKTLVAVALTGLTTSAVLGVVGSSGYLIAYTASDLAWSSTIDPTDFTPSQVTGAGGGGVAGLGGAILFCTFNSLGILIYTDTNVVAGTYTGNAQYPFKFRPVDNSKGGISLDLTASEANTTSQFVYSKAGMQSITSQTASIILPEVTDFLAGKKFEDFDATTELLTTTNLTATMKKKVKFIASRYLIISYGISSFTHAIVYDAALERLGKLKVTHTDVFEYVGDLASQVEVTKESIAFLSSTGAVSVLDFSTSAVSEGVALLGKLQLTKTRTATLLGVAIDNIAEGAALEVTDLYSLDGKNTAKKVGSLSYSEGLLREYVFRITGENHTLQLLGQFNLVSIIITYILNGRR